MRYVNKSVELRFHCCVHCEMRATYKTIKFDQTTKLFTIAQKIVVGFDF